MDIHKNGQALEWLLKAYERNTERYMEAEEILAEIYEMPWYQRAACKNKILKFMKSRIKYNDYIKK